MTNWRVTRALSALMDTFNTAFPTRDHASDGTIGDAAHQAEVSGHNPDDTPGVRAEYADADTIPEVRAIDVDSDLNRPSVGMQAVINAMLGTPNDLRRLKYIIFDRIIWSASNSWKPKVYTGASAHTEHAHFSGNPLYDEDATPWLSVLRFTEHTPAIAENEDDMGQSFGPIDILANEPTSLCIPPTSAGAADPRPAWLNIANDTFAQPYALRILGAVGGTFVRLPGQDANDMRVFKSAERASISLPTGCYLVTISRQAVDASGSAVAVLPPDADGKPVGPQPYAGHLTCCVERGAVA